ncbi:ATP-binding cassette domain-containing protein [Phormidesmis sp. 146-12]
MTAPQIRVEQVSLASRVLSKKSKLPIHYLLKNLSFEVMGGDRISIVGASGSGKTSLLRLLNRLSEPFEGTIYFEGQKFQAIPVIQLRQQIALVQQETKLLGMTVRDALRYPLKLRGLSETAIDRQLSDWIDRLHIPQKWLDLTELQLSMGERQWVAIARSMITQPKILLLDEPTSSLDAGRSSHLLKVLSELSQTVLMTNHQLDVAQSFSDRVLHLHKGALIGNEKSDRVNWQELEGAIVQAEAQEAEEWE